MISAIVATLGLIYDFAEDHPEIVKALADQARKLLSGQSDTPNQGASHALAAGLAAARSNAVQAALRRRGMGNAVQARRAVDRWARTASEQTLALLTEDVRNAMAELLRDSGKVQK